MGSIYAIKNMVNGKMYIGQTKKELKNNFSEHIAESKRKRSYGKKLYDAMREYGTYNFEMIELENVEDSLLDKKEVEYIKKYNTVEDGYNISVGGKGSSKLGISDAELVKLYERSGRNLTKLAGDLNCCRRTIADRLNVLGIETNKFDRRFTGDEVLVCKNAKGEEQARFSTCTDAAKWVIQNKYTDGTHIKNIGYRIKTKAKSKGSIYGFTWEIVEG